MNDARSRILQRLRANRPEQAPPPPVYSKPLHMDHAQRIARFTERMQVVRGEVQRVARDAWGDWLVRELPARDLRQVLLGTGPIGDRAAAALGDSVAVRRYTEPVDDWRAELFNDVDVAVTGARAGLAETGSLVLWPDSQEPRLMSLVPPVHIVLLDADRLYENFAEIIAAEGWSDGMPTNALLISGPSKTADIEQTLAYGIHGPKQLITLILD